MKSIQYSAATGKLVAVFLWLKSGILLFRIIIERRWETGFTL